MIVNLPCNNLTMPQGQDNTYIVTLPNMIVPFGSAHTTSVESWQKASTEKKRMWWDTVGTRRELLEDWLFSHVYMFPSSSQSTCVIKGRYATISTSFSSLCFGERVNRHSWVFLICWTLPCDLYWIQAFWRSKICIFLFSGRYPVIIQNQFILSSGRAVFRNLTCSFKYLWTLSSLSEWLFSLNAIPGPHQVGSAQHQTSWTGAPSRGIQLHSSSWFKEHIIFFIVAISSARTYFF